jgi:hypothetical protein
VFRAARGYAIPFVLLLLLLLAVAVSAYLGAVAASSRATASAVKERQAFYAADDLCRITAVVAQNYLNSVVNPTPEGLATFVAQEGGGATLPRLTPPGFVVRGADGGAGFEVLSLGTRQTKPIPSGPFADMMAVQTPVDLRVRAQQADGNASATCRQKVFLATVSAFQFYIFSDLYLDWDPGPLMTVRGRLHGNEDVCIAGAANDGAVEKGLKGDRVTAAGGIYRSHLTDNAGVGKPCRLRVSSDNVRFATDGSFSTFAKLDKDHTAADWKTWAETTYAGRVVDSAHGVTRLKLPITGRPRVQAGYNLAVTKPGAAVATYKVSNLENQRFLVDPVLVSEPQDVREQKLAWKADLRIINGVWYVRDPAAPDVPGTPIWSDHPGSVTITSEESTALPRPAVGVGQENLRTARTWATTPKRFSYYGYEAAADTNQGQMTWAANNPPAVVSYGSLFRDPDDGFDGGPYWYPGHWEARQAAADANGSSICTNGTPNTCVPPARIADTGTVAGDDVVLAEYGCLSRANTFVTNATCNANHHTALLNGTRSGFKSGWLEVRGIPGGDSLALLPDNNGRALSGRAEGITTAERDRSRLLPVNIDVAALQAALADCSGGELGSYFPKTCNNTGTREFNGVVYVTSTWPGALAGLGDTASSSGFASDWPHHGTSATNDANQPPAFNGLSQYAVGGVAAGPEQQTNQALPYPLCGGAGVADRAFDRGGGARFKIPSCANYSNNTSTNAIAAYPNAVRIINAATINPVADRTFAGLTVKRGILPRGLTIASNLPVYVVGDVNIETTPQEAPGATPANDHFVPFLIAGDRIIRLSSAWDDKRSRWGAPVGVFLRRATPTRHYFEAFAGWAITEASTGYHDLGLENFMKYHEAWETTAGGEVTARFFGAMVVGFASVYEAAGTSGVGDGTATKFQGFNAPHRDEGYDFHLDVPQRQPPGAPQYNVQGIFLWEAD